ncbi:hypothetical protein [Pelovirga terrestris]|uniref:Uncharacterized protein n=1 Tax=Pelovirga terrestris TaxID=2771352 RepID=A0A8J6QQZ6_9BACT|nr:hypothetical protein [Pelovirga terrestris]MBD1401666.1 hypothetical protein [Pelovirga terrestris]
MKKIIVVCIILLLASLLLNAELFPLSTKNYQCSYRPVDALFTAFVYTPLVRYKEGIGSEIDWYRSKKHRR